jgi:hypothetical protein
MTGFLEILVAPKWSRRFFSPNFLLATKVWAPDAEKILLDELRREVPVKTGATRDSLDAHVSGESLWATKIEFTGAGASGYLEHGTQPHRISASNSSVLRWFSQGGEELFAPSVSHPGMQPNDFVQRAVNNSKQQVFDRFKESVIATL